MPKYLLFDYPRREQFSKQMAVLQFVLRFAERHDRTLVIPRFRIYPEYHEKWLRDYAEEEYSYVRFSEIFDMGQLAGRKVVEFDDFEQPVDLLRYLEPVSVGGVDAPLNSFHRGEGFFNGRLIHAGQWRPYRDSRPLLGDQLDEDAETIAISEVLNSLPREHYSFRFAYHARYWNMAREFIAAELGEPFLGVHWRQGDFIEARPDAVIDHEEMRRRIAGRMASTGHGKIFLATDSTDRQRIGALSELELVEYPSGCKLEKMLVDTLVCALADDFLESPQSGFSRNIMELRAEAGEASPGLA